MGVLPLVFQDGANAASLGLTGKEVFTVAGIATGLEPRATITVRAVGDPQNLMQIVEGLA
jgi:aconitate hydratase